MGVTALIVTSLIFNDSREKVQTGLVEASTKFGIHSASKLVEGTSDFGNKFFAATVVTAVAIDLAANQAKK